MVWCGVVWCGVWGDTLKNTRVYVQNVSVCTGNTSTCVNTCARGAGTHGGVLNLHTEGWSSSVLLTKIFPRRVIACSRSSTKKPMHVTYFQFGNRSRTTRCRVLHFFASPEHTVQLQTGDTPHIQTRTHTTTQHRTRHSTEAKRREEERKETKRDRDEKRYT